MAKRALSDDKTEKPLPEPVDDASADHALACARALVEQAQSVVRMLEDPGVRQPDRWRLDTVVRKRAAGAQRAWIAMNVKTAPPSDAAWREYIRATIRGASWPFDERSDDGWPEDPEQRAIERGRREVRFAASIRQKLALLNPVFGDRLAGKDEVLFDALRAHFNPPGAGKKAKVTKQVALEKLDRVLGVWAIGAARTSRRRRG